MLLAKNLLFLYNGSKLDFNYEGSSFLVKIVDFNNQNRRNSVQIGGLKLQSGTTCTIDWGDGTKNTYTGSTCSPSHVYPNDDTEKFYLLKISDNVTGISWKGYNGNWPHIWYGITIGQKVTELYTYGFQNCNLYNIEGNIFSFRNITTICSYGLGTGLGTDLIFPKMTAFSGSMFYAGGLSHCINLYLPSVQTLNTSGLFGDWAGAGVMQNIYMPHKTCSQIRSMSYFPWFRSTDSAYNTVKFHGSDGVINSRGTMI